MGREPARAFTSVGLRPEATTRTRTSPGPGSGTGSSPTFRTSAAAPFFSYQAARMPPPRYGFTAGGIAIVPPSQVSSIGLSGRPRNLSPRRSPASTMFRRRARSVRATHPDRPRSTGGLPGDATTPPALVGGRSARPGGQGPVGWLSGLVQRQSLCHLARPDVPRESYRPGNRSACPGGHPGLACPRHTKQRSGEWLPAMNHSEIVSFLWGVADLIRDTFKRGKYRDVILPLTVRRLGVVRAADLEERGIPRRQL